MFSLFIDYFQNVIREGHRQSALFLLNTQKNLTTAEIHVISTFFMDLQNYVVDDKVELQDIVDTFFRNSFPLVLEYVNPSGKTVSSGYKQCLKTNIDSIQPFGKRPAQLVGIFEQTFEPVHNLLSSLKFGIEVLNMAQKFNFTSGCKNVLLQMKFCSMCQGLDKVKPCFRFCIDTVSNCLISEIELQAEWRSLIDTVVLLMESIGKSELEDFSNSIYKQLWNAATYVLIQKANFMSQVRISFMAFSSYCTWMTFQWVLFSMLFPHFFFSYLARSCYQRRLTSIFQLVIKSVIVHPASLPPFLVVDAGL